MNKRIQIRFGIARQRAVFFQKVVILSGAWRAFALFHKVVVLIHKAVILSGYFWILILSGGRRGDRSRRTCIRFFRPIPARILVLGLSVAAFTAAAQQPASNPVVLDSVVAVANKHAILSSDIDDEIRLSVLDPNLVGEGALTKQAALNQLISRALIEQQIRQEDIQSIEPSQDEVNARLGQIRQQLPACVHQNCATDAGWKLFLAAHGLTSERVESYLRYRLEILSFIEQRFRQGIQVSPQQIDEYYHQTLLPQYKPGEAIPSLDQVAPRIQEILLEQQVNVLFDAWLTNLRGQGDVEILDPSLQGPSLESAPTQNTSPTSSPVSSPAASSGATP
jgi:peptidyl-prolyl cis-trans isomerase SurA